MCRQPIASCLTRQARKRVDFNRHGLDARHQRRVEQPVRDVNACVVQCDAIDDEARQWAGFLPGFVAAQALDQRAEVVPAVAVNFQMQDRRLDACLRKGPRAVDCAAKFEIDPQPPETQHRAAFGRRQGQIADFETEPERIEMHRADADPVTELLGHQFLGLPLDDRR